MAANQPTPDFDDELLSAYVDNELTPRERAAVEQRLRTDEGARQMLAQLQRAADALKGLPARRLGRDLSADIWAAIELQRSESASDPQENEQAAVLTLPSDGAAGSAAKGRGLIWAALAIAAALLLMVLRPGAELGDQRTVAKQQEEKAEAKAPKDAKEDARDLTRVESASVDASGSGAARQETVNAESQSGATATAERSTGGESAAPRATPARSRVDRQGDGDRAGGQFTRNQAEMPQAMRGAAASAPAGVGPAKSAAQAEPEAVGAIAADGATGEQLRTIEVSASGADGVATFERLLVAHQVTLVDNGGESAPLADSAISAADGANATTLMESAPSDGAAESDRIQTAPPVAILVEASPEAIAGILASLQLQADNRYAVRSRADESQVAPMDSLAAGENGADEAATREAGAANNRAWRVPFDAYDDGSESLSKLAAAEPTAPPPATTAAPGEARGGAGFGGGGFGGRAVEGAETRERVLFILRPE